MNCPQSYFTKLQIASAIAVLSFVVLITGFSQSAYGATGINRTINFQGKLVDNNGVNVADSTYTVVFSIYDQTSGGTALWSETQSVTTIDGIFHVALGSSTAIPSDFNFNWDGLYLGMKVGSDLEMTPRIRMAAVPYAFNAEKVAGLTVTDENGNASTSGTLKIPNGKTISFGGAFSTTAGNALNFTTTADTTLALGGSGSLTLVDTSTSQTLTDKIIGNTGLTFTGATTDITTGTNQDLAIVPNGTGLIGVGTTVPASFFHVYGGTQGGNALAIFDQEGANTNDLFTASAAGTPVFTITHSGGIKLGTSIGTGTQCLLGGTTASWGPCGSGTSQWTTSGNNIYYAQAGGGVGIGTTSPATLLHLYDTRGGNASLIIDQQNTNADLFTASSAGSPKFVIDKSGNVGIGTTMPGAALQIANNPSLDELEVGDDIWTSNDSLVRFFMGSTTASSVFRMGQGANNFGFMGWNYNAAAASAYFTLSTNLGANVLSLQRDGGRVGIGTTQPAGLLHVTGSYAGNALAMFDQQNTNADLLTASSAGTPKFVIDKSGNVGVLTTKPVSQLQVNANTLYSDNEAGKHGMMIASGDDPSTNTMLYMGADDTNSIGYIQAVGHNFFRSLVLQGRGGNVGIGTSAPNSGLFVVSPSIAPAADVANFLNATGTSTTGVDGVQIDFKTAGTTASADNSGLRINVTAGGSGTTSTLEGLDIANLAGVASGNVTETALRIGTGWDKGLVFMGAEGTYTMQLASDAGTVASGITFGTTSPMSIYKSSNGQLTLGDGTNGLVLDAATGPVYQNGMRPTKTITLSAEYPGAVLTAFNGSASDTSITGSMTSDAEISSTNNMRTYYQWTSSQGSLNYYTVAVRVALPKDFSAWASGNTVTVDYATQSTSSSNNVVDVRIYKESNSTTAVSSKTGNVSSVASTYTTVNFTSTDLTGGSATWGASGAIETAVIYIRMGSLSNNVVKISDIKLNYLAKF